MATAAIDNLLPKRRRNSMDWLPPGMSELRVVLLGNSWSERSSVGNFILRRTEFNSEEEPDKCLKVRGRIKEKYVVLINTPDLLSLYSSEDKLTEHVTDCVRLSDPGPHVFLLVIQSEDFSLAQKLRLCRVLERFSNQSLDHSLLLISPRKYSSSIFKRCLSINDLIRELRYRYLELANLELPELLTRLGRIVKKNNGEHVSCHLFIDSTADSQRTQQEKTRPDTQNAGTSAGLHARDDRMTPPPKGEIRILLLGKNEDKLTKLGDFVTQKEQHRSHHFSKLLPGKQKSETGEWRGKPLKVVNTPDVFSLSVEKLRREMRNAVSLCPPGPNVLLLLVKPSEFTEENRQTLKIILSLFGQDALKHSVVVSSHEVGQPDDTFRRLLRDCGGRLYSMSEKKHGSLMTQIESLVNENRGAFLTLTEELIPLKSEHMKPALNLVLCGRRGSGKTSAAEAILGQTGLHSASSSSECVQHQGEVCGRWVSLVELPALCGKPLETVMKESLRRVSVCDPEGVHAFILVLPVGPLTDEDKEESKIIQETFGSRVSDFTMILFTLESDPSAPAVVNFVEKDQDIQRLIQSCGGRHLVLNIKDQHQIPKLMDMVEKIQGDEDKSRSYSTEMYTHAQMEKISKLHSELKDLTTCDDEEQSSDCIRIVLIGKTGCGKSSSGNTVLGRKEFKAESSQKSVTKYCQKKHGEVDSRPVTVVDTPGLFDTSLSHEAVHEEMINSISLLAPGPHVFLLVIQIGRFTPEEKETLKLIRDGFGKDAEKFTIVLLTGGDSLEYEKCSVEDYIENKCDDAFKKLISDCGGRYHMFNNYDDKNRTQVSELIAKIDTMVKINKGSCFTNEMLQEAETAIKKEMERLLKEKEEEMRKEREELQRKHEEEMREMEERMKKQEEDIKQERERRERELKEKEEIIKKELENRRIEKKRREEEDWKRKEQDQLQRLQWEHKYEVLEEKIMLESEEKETIKRHMEQSREKMREERESWEKIQKEWWEKRNQEEEQRRQEEETRLRKLQEEFDQEREKYEKKRKEEDQKRQEEEEELKKQQRQEIKEERKHKEKELKEMEENIKKEREARMREQQWREIEEKRRIEQEELQRLEWEQKYEVLEEKIKLELEKKETIDRQLEESGERLKEERESWERKQKEWWEKRNQEEEQRRQEEETRLRKLQEEFEQEREKYEKRRKEEDLMRQEEEEKLRKQQREEIENERKKKEKELKEMEEIIKKEPEARLKERQLREEEDRKRKEREELQRLEWEQTFSVLEEKIKLETEEKDNIYKQLEESREKMREEKESWEEKQNEWWEKRNEEEEQRRQEEQTKLRKLQEEFEQEREKYEKKRKEEDQKRQEEEVREKKAMQENHEKEKENLKKMYEEEARKKAEEFNEFKEKNKKEYAAQKEEYEKQMKEKEEKYDILKSLKTYVEEQMKKNQLRKIRDILKCATKKKGNAQKISDLLKKQEEEMNKQRNEEEKKNLQDKHDKEMDEVLEELLKQANIPECILS